MPDSHRGRLSRIVLKISGEGFCRAGEKGVEPTQVAEIARQIEAVHKMPRSIAVVAGAGNLVRGAVFEQMGMVRAQADHMGMVATVINALALQDALERLGVETRVMTAIAMGQVAEPYIRRRAMRHLERGRVIILAGGTGNPFFTTDTTAALRAAEIGADALLKATQVDGVYSADPKQVPDARLLRRLDYLEVVRRQYRVMDLTAVTLCMENKMPIVVFNLWKEGNLRRVVEGEPVGTFVTSAPADGTSEGDLRHAN